MSTSSSTNRAAFISTIPALAVAAAMPAAAQSAPDKLRIGLTPSDGFGEGYYGHDAGFFSDAGIDLEIQNFNAEAQIVAAVIGGSLDIGIATPTTMAPAHLHGIPIAYISAGSIYSSKVPTLALIVAKNNPIRHAKELEGTTVGVFGVQDSSQLGMLAWLAHEGVDLAKMKFIPFGRPELVGAVERGTLAAGIIGEPYLSAALAGACREFGKPFDVFGDRALLGGYATTLDVIGKNGPLLRRFNAAMYKTAKWANANRDKTALILQKYTKITDDTMKTMRRVNFAESLELSMIQPTLDLAYQYKFIDAPVKAADLIRKP